jgi:hypothetical protein
MTSLLGRATPTLCILLAVPAAAQTEQPAEPTGRYTDSTITVSLPAGWRIEGGEGEYLLESDDEDAASLLLLVPEEDRSLEERLAAIEAQFLATGIIELEASESLAEDGEDVFYRRYRLIMGGAEDGDSALLLHQYSFWRADVQVLLQVECVPEHIGPKDLFFRIFQTLEIHAAPHPFVFEDGIEGD